MTTSFIEVAKHCHQQDFFLWVLFENKHEACPTRGATYKQLWGVSYNLAALASNTPMHLRGIKFATCSQWEVISQQLWDICHNLATPASNAPMHTLPLTMGWCPVIM